MAGSSRIEPVGDTPVQLSSAPADNTSGQSIVAVPLDGSITYGYDDTIAFGAGMRVGTNATDDQMDGVSKFLQPGEELWAVADAGLTVQVAIDENGV